MANLKSSSQPTAVRTGAAGSGDATLTPAAAAGLAGTGATRRIGGGLLDPKMLWKSLPDAFLKFDPRVQLKNPVMFVVAAGSVLTTYSAIIPSPIFAWTLTVSP